MNAEKDEYIKKYSDLLSKAFYDKNEESIRNIIDRVYTDGFEDGATEKSTDDNVIEIEVYRGCVTTVMNLPDGWQYKILDRDAEGCGEPIKEHSKEFVMEIVRNVKNKIRTKNDLKVCGCKSCKRALKILDSETKWKKSRTQ